MFVAVGDFVKEDEVVCEIETDKVIFVVINSLILIHIVWNQ